MSKALELPYTQNCPVGTAIYSMTQDGASAGVAELYYLLVNNGFYMFNPISCPAPASCSISLQSALPCLQLVRAHLAAMGYGCTVSE